MPRICHVTPFFNEQYGGSERYVNTITAEQRDKGLNVTILTTTRSRSKVGRDFNDGIEIVRIFSYKDIWSINPVSIILPFLIKRKFDIIHTHSHLYFTSNQVALVRKVKKIPFLLHLHGGVGLPPYRTGILSRTAKAFYDKTFGKETICSADIVASVSKKDLQKLKYIYNIPKKKLIYIPNAIDLSLFSSLRNNGESGKDKFSILYIGDIEPWKGINFLEKWIKGKRTKIKHKIRFRFIGQGSLASRVQALQRTSEKTNISVEYLGEKPHNMIPKFLKETDLLILPSYWEGLPTVILEAMAARVPVISTPVGDIPYVIQNGFNGFLFNHSLKSLDKTLNFILKNQDQLEDIGKNAYHTVANNFSVEIINNKILEVYGRFLKTNLVK